MYKLTIVEFYTNRVLYVGFFRDEIFARRTSCALSETYEKGLNLYIEVFFEKI